MNNMNNKGHVSVVEVLQAELQHAMHARAAGIAERTSIKQKLKEKHVLSCSDDEIGAAKAKLDEQARQMNARLDELNVEITQAERDSKTLQKELEAAYAQLVAFETTVAKYDKAAAANKLNIRQDDRAERELAQREAIAAELRELDEDQDEHHAAEDNNMGQHAQRQPEVGEAKDRLIKLPPGAPILKHGTKEFDLETFFASFERTCTAQGIKVHELGRLLLGSIADEELANRVHTWAQVKTANGLARCHSWDLVKQHIRLAIPQVNRHAEHYAALTQLKQSAQENIAVYNHKWGFLAGKAHMQIEDENTALLYLSSLTPLLKNRVELQLEALKIGQATTGKAEEVVLLSKMQSMAFICARYLTDPPPALAHSGTPAQSAARPFCQIHGFRNHTDAQCTQQAKYGSKAPLLQQAAGQRLFGFQQTAQATGANQWQGAHSAQGPRHGQGFQQWQGPPQQATFNQPRIAGQQHQATSSTSVQQRQTFGGQFGAGALPRKHNPAIQCYKCGQTGHTQRECTNAATPPVQSQPQAGTGVRLHAMRSTQEEEEPKEHHDLAEEEAFCSEVWAIDNMDELEEDHSSVHMDVMTAEQQPCYADKVNSYSGANTKWQSRPFCSRKYDLATQAEQAELAQNNPLLRQLVAERIAEIRNSVQDNIKHILSRSPFATTKELRTLEHKTKFRRYLEKKLDKMQETRNTQLEERLYLNDAELCVSTSTLSTIEASSHYNIQADARPFVPVEITLPGGTLVKLHMLLDTGADKSFLSTTFAEKYALPAGKTTGVVTVASGATFPRMILQDTLAVNVGLFSFSHVFDAAAVPYDGVMGIDIIEKSGIRITGIPSRFPSQAEAAAKDSGEGEEKQPHVSQDSTSNAISYAKERALISKHMRRNQELSGKHSFISFPQSEVQIIYNDNTKPVYTHPYAAKPEDIPHLQEFLRKGLESGKLRKVSAEEVVRVNVPIFVVHPPANTGRKARVVGDFRRQNEGLRVIPFSIPTISEILQHCAEAQLFSELDLKDAFPQFRIRDEDQLKVAFRLLGCTYAFIGAPLGLVHLSEHCQRVMATMLEEFQPFVLVYIDNIFIITGNDVSMHMRIVLAVLATLTQHNVLLNEAKCFFLLPSIAILGHVVSPKGIELDPKKTKQVEQWVSPASAADVMRFMGFVNFLREHIRGFSMLAAPINALRLASTKEFTWSEEAEQSFQLLKRAIATAPLLRFPTWTKAFTIAIDASNRGVGAVLYQPENATDLPAANTIISFASRSLLPYERSYSTYKLELLGLLFGLASFDDFVRTRAFTVLTDNRALSFILAQAHLNKTQANWLARIMDYRFTVTHVPGTENWVADFLSRAFTDTWGISPTHRAGHVRAAKTAPVKLDTHTSASTPATTDATTGAEPNTTSPTAATTEQEALITEAHTLGHYGVSATHNRLRTNGHNWPFMIQHIKTTLQNCAPCQSWTRQKHTFTPLQSISARFPWDHLQLDLLTSFPAASTGEKYLLVIIDVFTSFVLLRSLADKQAVTIAAILWNVFCDFGVPKILQMDNESTLRSAVIASLMDTFGIAHSAIAAYNPRQNGKVERAIASVATSIRKSLSQAGGEWVNLVAFAQLAFNNKIRADTNTDPFSLLFNRQLNPFASYASFPADSPLAFEAWKQHQLTIRNAVFPVITDKQHSAQNKAQRNFNSRHQISAKPLAPGTTVVIEDVTRSNKNEPPFVGPYTVVSAASASAYWVKDSVNSILQRAIPRQQIKVLDLARVPQAPHVLQPPTQAHTSQLDSQLPSGQFYVERITAHRVNKGKNEYKVKWSGYDDADSTWEPANNIENSLVQQYLATLRRLTKSKDSSKARK